MTGTEVEVMHSGDRRGHELSNSGSLSYLEKSRKWILLWSLQEEYRSINTLILVPEDSFQTSNLQNCWTFVDI